MKTRESVMKEIEWYVDRANKLANLHNELNSLITKDHSVDELSDILHILRMKAIGN